MELADLIVINKADGDFKTAAKIAASDVKNALHFMKPKSEHWIVDTLEISALNNQGIESVWHKVEEYKDVMIKQGEFEAKRNQQSIDNIWTDISDLMAAKIKASMKSDIAKIEKKVSNNQMTSRQAAETLIKVLFKQK